jgi:C1A family cysteine protease
MKKSIQLIALSILLGLSTYGQNFIQVTKLNALESVSITRQQVLEIKLPSQPSTGFGWYLKNNEQEIVEQVGDWDFVSNDINNPIGTPGIQTIRYIGAARGIDDLEFLYKRPWEDDSQATDNYTIKVTSEGIYNGKSLVTEKEADESISPTTVNYSVYGLPSSFSWQKQGLCTPCKNQGSCGSCWTFAACGSFESVIKIFDGVTRDLSEQWLVNCDKRYKGCSGGWCPNSMFKTGAVYEADQKYAAANGTCKSSYTYHEKIIGSYELATNPTVAQIKQAIYDYGPVWVAVDAGSNFSNYKSGVLSKSDGSQVNHAVVLVGWDDASSSWVLRNSWGTGWGENNGYMRIKYGISAVGYKATYIDYKGKILHTTTSINDNVSNSAIKLFPNPSNGTFNIEGLEKPNTIEIYDVVGKMIYKTISDNSTTTVNLSSTAKGMYFYKITNLSTNTIIQGKLTLN